VTADFVFFEQLISYIKALKIILERKYNISERSKTKKQRLAVRSGIACIAKVGIFCNVSSDGMKKIESDSNFLNLLNPLEKNNFKPETYINTNVEAPKSSINPMSSILINISGPAIMEAIRVANKYQMPFDILFFNQLNINLPFIFIA